MSIMSRFMSAIIFISMMSSIATARELTAVQVADRIQGLYDATKDFQAAFLQEYSSKMLGRKKTSSGFVYIKKPGMMRWDYKKPKPKHFVANGQALYVYDPGLEQVIVDRTFKSSSLTTAVTFLWGKGKLSDEFYIALLDPTDKTEPHHYRLMLKPKKTARFKTLTFVVNRKTFQVLETIVEDPGGNTNHIVFSKTSKNIGLKDQVFHFKIPKGIEVIETPGSSSADK